MTTFDELVADQGWVIADGATGTNYYIVCFHDD